LDVADEFSLSPDVSSMEEGQQEDRELKRDRYIEAFYTLRGTLHHIPDPYARAPLHEMLNDLFSAALASLESAHAAENGSRQASSPADASTVRSSQP
jgi:hypothetical protein